MLNGLIKTWKSLIKNNFNVLLYSKSLFWNNSSGSRGWDVGVVCPRCAWELILSLTVDAYGALYGHRECDKDLFSLV